MGELVRLFDVPVGSTATKPYSACECCSTQLNTGDSCQVCIEKGLHRCGKPTRTATICRRWTIHPDGCPAHR